MGRSRDLGKRFGGYTMKLTIATLLIIVYGFAAFVAFSFFGFAIAAVFTVYPWWGVVLGKLFGSFAVAYYLLDKE
jgi:hypothetical protein